MVFQSFRMAYVDTAYLKALWDEDHEVRFQEKAYENKPHLGILVGQNGMQYLIPITSAKHKHIYMPNSTQTTVTLYELVEPGVDNITAGAVLRPVRDLNLLHEKGVPDSEAGRYQERVISVVEINKMIPVKSGVYTLADLKTPPTLCKEEMLRRQLLRKEYGLCYLKRDAILRKANKLYENQMKSGKIAGFCCNFALLEKVCQSYGT